MSNLNLLLLAIDYVENGAEKAQELPAMCSYKAIYLSPFCNAPLPHYVNIKTHVIDKNGVVHYKTVWFWESSGVTNVLFVTEKACRNEYIKKLIVYYKKVNKLE